MYFEYEHLPFNKFLFSEYLDFMAHFENKDGYYDDLMSVVSSGLKKAKKEFIPSKSGGQHIGVDCVKTNYREC